MSGFFSSPFAGKKDSSSIYKDIFFKSPVGMCVVTHPDFEIKLVNNNFARLFGKNKSDITGKLFVAVWKKSPLRDEFFTSLRKDGVVNDFKLSSLGSGQTRKDVVLSAKKIDEENFLICAVLCSCD